MKTATTGFVQVVDPPKERRLEWGFEVCCKSCKRPITDEDFKTAIYVDTVDGPGWETRHGPFHKDCGEEFSKMANEAASR